MAIRQGKAYLFTDQTTNLTKLNTYRREYFQSRSPSLPKCSDTTVVFSKYRVAKRKLQGQRSLETSRSHTVIRLKQALIVIHLRREMLSLRANSTAWWEVRLVRVYALSVDFYWESRKRNKLSDRRYRKWKKKEMKISLKKKGKAGRWAIKRYQNHKYF